MRQQRFWTQTILGGRWYLGLGRNTPFQCLASTYVELSDYALFGNLLLTPYPSSPS
jgi:hypothetical protein